MRSAGRSRDRNLPYKSNNLSDEIRKTSPLDDLAEDGGVAIVIVDEAANELSVSNNNSICAALYPSKDFGPQCAEYCGRAFEMAAEAGKTVSYQCYAGLDCRGVPIRSGQKQLVAIVGRTFLKAENYRRATTRSISGDWREFSPGKFFENVLITGSESRLEKLSRRIEELSDDEKNETFSTIDAFQTSESGPLLQPDEITTLIEQFNHDTKAPESEPRPDYDADHIAEWRSLFGSLLKVDLRRACSSILEFLERRYDLPALIWLERRDSRLVSFMSRGTIEGRLVRIEIAADDRRLIDAATNQSSLALTERSKPGAMKPKRTINLFPVMFGGEIRSALAGGGTLDDEEKIRQIARFCQAVATQLEVLRLRDEVARQDTLAQAVRRFNENLKKIDTDDFWQHLTQISAEILQAERASLLVRNENAEGLNARASIGARVDLRGEKNLGGRVAQKILDRGKPIVISDVRKVGIGSAPADRKYKTSSFISYPIAIGERGIGVLNFTDKTGGQIFGRSDLELLDAIAPQIAVAIDRTSLKYQAGQFEQLSVTDPLTGLLNRRYIEERLAEEIKRSTRHSFPMSFLMIDVDDFKAYNDVYGHLAGDDALKIVGQAIRDTLRGADVAARYGGEEFSVLLPQTTAEEAGIIAERIRRAIEESEFAHRKITVSIGIASCSPAINSATELISAADKALYEAKRQGRNNVQNYGDLGADASEKLHY